MSLQIQPPIPETPLETWCKNAPNMVAQNFETNYASYHNSWTFVWKNTAYTPDQVVAGLGVNAFLLFAEHIDTGNRLAAQALRLGRVFSPLAIPAGWSVTFNPDGSAAATYTAPPEPESPESSESEEYPEYPQ